MDEYSESTVLKSARYLSITLFCLNIITLIGVSLQLLPSSELHLYERHHMILFLFILVSGTLTAQINQNRYARVICWYIGMILMLTALLFFIETFVYANFIFSFFQIHEGTSLLSIICFIFLAICLFDFAINRQTFRIFLYALLVILTSLISLILSYFNFQMRIVMSIYSAINFILIGSSLILYYYSSKSRIDETTRMDNLE